MNRKDKRKTDQRRAAKQITVQQSKQKGLLVKIHRKQLTTARHGETTMKTLAFASSQ